MSTLPFKPSCFNHYFHFTDRGMNLYAIYNAFSNGLASVEPTLYDRLKDNALTEDDVKCMDYENVWPELKRGLILVDSDLDEIAALKFMWLKTRFDSNTLSLTIVTTHACNLNCEYCYQRVGFGTKGVNSGNDTTDKQSITLEGRHEDEILDFVENLVNNGNYKTLRILWYGGEPLLNLRSIDNLTAQFITLCNERGLTYTAHMISNGVNLTSDIAQHLVSLAVSNVQITIDGPKEIHDMRRPYKGRPSASSFDAIMSNVVAVYGTIPIGLRINIDSTNIDHLSSLFEYLQRLGLLKDPSKLAIDLAPTRESCNSLLSSEFWRQRQHVAQELERCGYPGIAMRYPHMAFQCAATALHYYVIEPDGHYHKCLECVGLKDEYLGHITKPITIGQRALEWLKYDPTEMSNDCRTCNFLPICAGGCPYYRMRAPQIISNDPSFTCVEWKVTLTDQLHRVIERRCSCAPANTGPHSS